MRFTKINKKTKSLNWLAFCDLILIPTRINPATAQKEITALNKSGLFIVYPRKVIINGCVINQLNWLRICPIEIIETRSFKSKPLNEIMEKLMIPDINTAIKIPKLTQIKFCLSLTKSMRFSKNSRNAIGNIISVNIG